jgi:hypothetical protein
MTHQLLPLDADHLSSAKPHTQWTDSHCHAFFSVPPSGRTVLSEPRKRLAIHQQQENRMWTIAPINLLTA